MESCILARKTIMYQEIFTGISRMAITQEQLGNIKERYQQNINSRRCFERISSMEQLLKILEKRDCLSVENIQVFIEIATSFNQTGLLDLIRNYNQQETASPPVSPNGVAAFVVPPPAQPGLAFAYYVIPPVPQDLKQRVYLEIADSIGKSWQDFARALQVREGDIDGLNKLPLKERIYGILRFHEESCDRRVWKTNLLDALDTARRKDIRLKVQSIFDTH